MDRIIEVKVCGNHLSKDNKNAGVRGEANVTNLRITFDEGWGGYAKKITFWDALGKNPVERTLTADLLENIVKSTSVYIVPIPGEAMAEAGKLTFVIDGYVDGKRQRSISDKLEVKDAPIADNAGEPADPMPSQAEQLQGQIDTLLDDIQSERRVVETAAKTVGIALDLTDTNAKKTTAHAELTGQYKEEARGYAESAAESEAKAHEALGKTNYIGDNGNWFAWDSAKGAFYDTEVKAQAGSTVYLGDNPPDEADVWINPDGTPSGFYNIEETNALLAEKASKTDIVNLYKYKGSVENYEDLPAKMELIPKGTVKVGEKDVAVVEDGVLKLKGITLTGPAQMKIPIEPIILNGNCWSDAMLDGYYMDIGVINTYGCLSYGYIFDTGVVEVDCVYVDLNVMGTVTFGQDYTSLGAVYRVPSRYEAGKEDVLYDFSLDIGDVYNLLGDDSNVAWTGKDWHNLGGWHRDDKARRMILDLSNKVAPSPASVTLYKSKWIQDAEKMWHQEVQVNNAAITIYSKVDLQLNAEQLAMFYEKDIALVTENDGGTITVYCVGTLPEDDLTIQATVSEVLVGGE